MKPNLSWSYRIQAVAEAPADLTLHTFAANTKAAATVKMLKPQVDALLEKLGAPEVSVLTDAEAAEEPEKQRLQKCEAFKLLGEVKLVIAWGCTEVGH
eukprot:Skav225829  [mRNA]  locus=scaffold3351:7704:11775:+ [translate_table: standard]